MLGTIVNSIAVMVGCLVGLLLKGRLTEKISTTNCPNCGAPTQITSAGKCEYCGSIITTGEYSWVLSNLEREIK